MGANPWFTHVKKYAAEHKITYKEAIVAARATYTPLVVVKKPAGKRGRPKKDPLTLKANAASTGPSKGRGRPPKITAAAEKEDTATSSETTAP